MNQRLMYSSCLIEAVKAKIRQPQGIIGYDFNSPSKLPSFYFDINGERWRFRRKIRRQGNKNLLIFWGYKVVE
jgi:hypothetical protein